MEVSVSVDDLHPEDISEIMAKKQRLYVLGTIEYDDGFGKQKFTSVMNISPRRANSGSSDQISNCPKSHS